MIWSRFKPTSKAIWVWSLIAALVLFIELGRVAQGDDIEHWLFAPWPTFLLVSLSLLTLFDLLLSWTFADVRIERKLPHNVSLGKATQIELACQHEQPRAIQLKLYEHLPLHFDAGSMPLTATIPASTKRTLSYHTQAQQRGEALIDGIDVQAFSWMGFWLLKRHHAVQSTIKVFPNFATIEGMKLIAVEHQNSQLGIRQKPRRGQGTDFHELRDYRDGDTLRQIDWNATSRRRKLISRHYQEERDQNIILMLDSGRRMMAQEGSSTYFDHCLNGLLMLSYVALKQGDSVSMMSFDRHQHWSTSVKGNHGITALLQRFYDLYPKPTAVDYLGAAQDVMNKGFKRSLVVLTTNLREDDIDEIVSAVTLLKKKHMVIVANLREASLDDIDNQAVENLNQALTYAGLSTYLEAREKLLNKLSVMRVTALDCPPEALTSHLVSSYLAIKRAGQL